MCVERNIEARSCNHCCSGKAISVTYSECVFVALGILHAMLKPHIVICGLPCSAIFFHVISNGTIFEKYIEYKMCFDFLYKFLSETFLILRRTERDTI